MSKFKSIKVGGSTLECGNSKVWPPSHVTVYGTDIESYRGEITPQVYHKLRTWKTVCGLTSMDQEKCLQCPHIVVNGSPSNTPGTGKRVALGRNTPLKYKKGKSNP